MRDHRAALARERFWKAFFGTVVVGIVMFFFIVAVKHDAAADRVRPAANPMIHERTDLFEHSCVNGILYYIRGNAFASAIDSETLLPKRCEVK